MRNPQHPRQGRASVGVILARAFALLGPALVVQLTPAQAEPAAPDIYLPENGAGSLCYNPDSQKLRQFVSRGRWKNADPLDRAALAQDLDFLHEVMKREYVAYGHMLQQRGFDPAAFLARWRGDVAAGSGPVTFEHGVLRPMMALRRQFRDEHLSLAFAPYAIMFPEGAEVEYSEFQTAAFDPSIDLSTCDVGPEGAGFTLRKVAALKSDGAIEERITLSAVGNGPQRSLACKGATLTLTRRAPHRLPAGEGPLYEWQEVGDVGVIRVRSLSGPPEKFAVFEQFDKDYGKHRRKRLLVFDFRGNGGGATGPIQRWIRQAKRGTWSYCRGTIQLERDLDACSTWNDLVISQIRAGTVDGASARADRDKERQKWPRMAREPREVMEDGINEAKATTPYRGRIVALVDRGTGSSAENGAQFLRRALGALVVGERTTGALEYGNVAAVFLPRTGLRATLATKRWFLEESVESVGIPVEYYLDDLAVAAEALVPRLKQLVRHHDSVARMAQ